MFRIVIRVDGGVRYRHLDRCRGWDEVYADECRLADGRSILARLEHQLQVLVVVDGAVALRYQQRLLNALATLQLELAAFLAVAQRCAVHHQFGTVRIAAVLTLQHVFAGGVCFAGVRELQLELRCRTRRYIGHNGIAHQTHLGFLHAHSRFVELHPCQVVFRIGRTLVGVAGLSAKRAEDGTPRSGRLIDVHRQGGGRLCVADRPVDSLRHRGRGVTTVLRAGFLVMKDGGIETYLVNQKTGIRLAVDDGRIVEGVTCCLFLCECRSVGDAGTAGYAVVLLQISALVAKGRQLVFLVLGYPLLPDVYLVQTVLDGID